MKINFNGLVLASLVAASCPFMARAQTEAPIVAGKAGTLQQFLSGDLVPLDLKFSQMKTGWNRVHIERKGAAEKESDQSAYPGIDPLASGFRRYFGQGSDAVWTQGRTVMLNGQEQLVVYRAQFPSFSEVDAWFEAHMPAAMKNPDTSEEQRIEAILPAVREFLDTVPLRASLVSVGEIGTLKDVEKFNYERSFAALERDVRDPNSPFNRQREQRRTATSEAMMQILAQGFQNYVADYENTLPPLDNWAVANEKLQPYIKGEIKLARPGQELRPNSLLSSKKLAHLQPYAQSLIVFYSSPDDENQRWVMFLDGEVRQVNQAQWPQIKKASRLP